jgi:hypothetical protein
LRRKLVLRQKLLLVEVLALLSVVTGSVLFATSLPQVEYEVEYYYVHEVVLEDMGPESYAVQDFNLRVPLNTSTQTSYMVNCTPVGTLQSDEQGNPYIAVPETILKPGGSLTARTTITVLIKMSPIIVGEGSGCFSSIPRELIDQFTKKGAPFLADDPDIKSLAESVSKGSNCAQGEVITMVEGMTNWIDQNVRNETHMPPLYPNQTLIAGSGGSDEKASLLIAMCRAIGIPAYLQTGFLIGSNETATYLDGHFRSEGLAIHAWAVVYIPTLGWMPVDMTYYDSSQDSISHITTSAWASGLAIQGSNVVNQDYVADWKKFKDALYDRDIYVVDSNKLNMLKSETRLVYRAQFFAGFALLSSGAAVMIATRVYKRKKLPKGEASPAERDKEQTSDREHYSV